MKKLLFYLILLTFLFVPFSVRAEGENIVVNSIVKENITGKTSEYSEPTVDGLIINYDVRFREVGDSIKYKINITNNDSEDFHLGENISSLSNSKIKYEIEYGDALLKAGESRDIELTITYKIQANSSDFSGGLYKDGNNLQILLRDKEAQIIFAGNTLADSIIKVIGVIAIIALIGVVIFILVKNKKSNILLLVLMLALVPKGVKALKTITININNQVAVEMNPCTYYVELVDNAQYLTNQYLYKYKADSNGWSVILNDKNSTDPVNETLCTSINNKPIVDMNNMFGSSKTTSIDTSSFDTSQVTNMSNMFNYCLNLEDIDVSMFDTSKVQNMSVMFNNNPNIESLDLAHFDTSSITSNNGYGGMFQGMTNLKYLNLDGWDFSKGSFNYALPGITGETVILDNAKFSGNLNYLFGQSNTIKKLSMKNADMSQVTSMASMFYNSTIEELDVSGWDTSNVTTMDRMFYGLENVKELDVSEFNVSNVLSFAWMFGEMHNLESIDISKWETSSLKTMAYMFARNYKLKKLDFSNFDISNGSELPYAIMMGCHDVTEINLSNWDMSYTSNSYAMARMLTGSSYGFGSERESDYSLKKIIMDNVKFSSNMSHTFAYLYTIEEISLKNVDTSQATDFSGMFSEAYKLKSLDLTSFDSSNVTKMYSMFLYCSSLTTLDLSSFDFSKVTDFTGIFINSTIKKVYVRSESDKNILENAINNPNISVEVK